MTDAPSPTEKMREEARRWADSTHGRGAHGHPRYMSAEVEAFAAGMAVERGRVVEAMRTHASRLGVDTVSGILMLEEADAIMCGDHWEDTDGET